MLKSGATHLSMSLGFMIYQGAFRSEGFLAKLTVKLKLLNIHIYERLCNSLSLSHLLYCLTMIIPVMSLVGRRSTETFLTYFTNEI